jgi:hypothetical protein
LVESATTPANVAVVRWANPVFAATKKTKRTIDTFQNFETIPPPISPPLWRFGALAGGCQYQDLFLTKLADVTSLVQDKSIAPLCPLHAFVFYAEPRPQTHGSQA